MTSLYDFIHDDLLRKWMDLNVFHSRIVSREIFVAYIPTESDLIGWSSSVAFSRTSDLIEVACEEIVSLKMPVG